VKSLRCTAINVHAFNGEERMNRKMGRWEDRKIRREALTTGLIQCLESTIARQAQPTEGETIPTLDLSSSSPSSLSYLEVENFLERDR
jgi:hypothetical protein